MKPQLHLTTTAKGTAVSVSGSWRLSDLTEIPQLRALPSSPPNCVSADNLEEIDTAGALALLETLQNAGINTKDLPISGLNPQQQSIISLVQKRPREENAVEANGSQPILERLGRGSIEELKYLAGFVGFFGETLSNFLYAILRPRVFRLREFFVQLEVVCINAVPIVAMVTFLIGLVFAYLFSSQSVRYGANIFIVDAVGIAMCRELSPIIVAIIMAGRSGSAFTAQLGTMKINEEIDAIQILGLSPSQVLVIPRVLALILAMPLLVFVGDAVGIAAGAIVGNLYLGITPTTYIDRLQVVLPMRHLLIGLVKAPIFAFFIATIGCHMGLTVENNARSVGLKTTSTVVQSIVSVILLNAAFAIILVELKL